MAEKGSVQIQDSIRQAGGGQQGERDKSIEIDASFLPHLESIFKNHAGPDKKWHKNELATFLHHVQSDDPADSSSFTIQDELDFSNFLKYITSSTGNILRPPPKNDLSWPLSSYYISSSHNTYLTGNQLYSDSSTDAYKNVLLRGCRCIEIDVWDGDDSDSDSSDEESDEEYTEKKNLKSANRKERLAKKIPGSISSRLEKTSLGKRLEKYTSNESKTGAESSSPPAKESHADAPSISSLKRQSTPQAVAIEPRVLHGYTLTKEVSFREVCETIKEYAFTVSELPLIVSLEIHCSSAQQEVIVSIMNDVWSSFLLPRPDSDAQVLPSPHDLRRKILVKVKYAPPGTTPSTTASNTESLPPEAAASKTAADKQKKPSKIIQALSDFGIYTRGVSYKSLAQPEAAMPTHIFSLSERGVMEVHETQAPELFKHNQKYMMRTYPSGMRIGSSNLDPPVFWRKGIQIVALNWQKWDEGMMLNEGMFAGTGGYVLKPEGYRIGKDNSATPSTVDKSIAAPGTPATRVIAKTLNLKITVFAAQNLPLPEKDDTASGFRPYVKVEVHTEPHHAHSLKEQSGKAKEGEYKAKTKTRKGISPSFEGETLEFKSIEGVTPELAFVRFLVKDDEIGRNDLSAWACVRLDRLRSGYRFVKLMDAQGVESKGVLLVKIEKKLT